MSSEPSNAASLALQRHIVTCWKCTSQTLGTFLGLMLLSHPDYFLLSVFLILLKELFLPLQLFAALLVFPKEM